MSVSGGGRSIARLIFSGSLSVSRLKRFCFGFRGMAGCCEEPPSCGGTAARRGLSGTARRECGGAGRRRRTVCASMFSVSILVCVCFARKRLHAKKQRAPGRG